MDILKKYITEVRNSIGAYKLTINGEIKINDKKGTNLLQLTEEERSVLRKIQADLKEKFYYLKIEVQENLVEMNIKFFACEKFIAQEKFLEDFRSALALSLQKINESTHLNASTSARGVFLSKAERQHFIFLSKVSMVEYKVIEKVTQSGISEVLLHQVKIYGLTIVFVTLIIYNLYYLYAYIPDHDPSKLLGNVFKV